ncbi:DegT/DnrJ/EryC1/StrS family aminotransferase [Xylanibacillus composti]|uniref:Pleiotropic regulatory protein n=1 Tax=Xylanibacillus composti TaxID=1572762 RepID=A0A8J4M0Q1_9BACL|nr:DegT/DnrJ/EryC1/StrS family aminotransferase [Xylanibacillus composti]MDT9726194.1 DegT/DnrJ/EryC1/StrS family aminotransferase [Xylanibacillus composti]GIQ68040.1 pleiotropic regulatory protein [Xylanibacillus composti]
MKVPFYTGAVSFKRQWPLIAAKLDQILDQGLFTNGPVVKELERAMETFTGAKHAIAVGNATEALVIMLKAAGIGPGDEVIVPSFTFFASASSIVHAGAVPVFCDIDPVTYMLKPDELEDKVTARTKAIMPVHLFTQMADMKAICEIAEKHGLLVLEDSAEAISMFHEGKHAGIVGQAGVISFFPTKTLGAIGDAGLILTNRDDLAARARLLRLHGQEEDEPYVHHLVGTNSRMDDIQAAVLLARLQYLPSEIAKRSHWATLYDRLLADLPQVQTPHIRVREEAANPVYYVYLIEAEQRDELVEYLSEQGIGTETYYPIPLHLQPCFSHLGYEPGSMPHAEHACSRTVGLPMYPDLQEADVRAVCEAIRKFYESGGEG